MSYRYRSPSYLGGMLVFALSGCANVPQNEVITLENVEAAKAAELSVAQAANIVQQTTEGALAEVKFRSGSGYSYYIVKVISDRATSYVTLDANTGAVISENRKWHQVAWRKRRDRAERMHIRYSNASLRAAVLHAEEITGGKAIEVAVDYQPSPKYFEVKTLKGGRYTTIKIAFDKEKEASAY